MTYKPTAQAKQKFENKKRPNLEQPNFSQISKTTHARKIKSAENSPIHQKRKIRNFDETLHAQSKKAQKSQNYKNSKNG